MARTDLQDELYLLLQNQLQSLPRLDGEILLSVGLGIHELRCRPKVFNKQAPCLVRSSPQRERRRLLSAAEALRVLGQMLLVEGQTQRLRRPAQRGRLAGGLLLLRVGRRPPLDLLLALDALAPGRQHHVSVERGLELRPRAHRADVRIALAPRLLQQRRLDRLQLPFTPLRGSTASLASSSIFSHATVRFPAGVRSSRRAKTTCCASKSRGPSSMRSGTPFCSQSANFQPGL